MEGAQEYLYNNFSSSQRKKIYIYKSLMVNGIMILGAILTHIESQQHREIAQTFLFTLAAYLAIAVKGRLGKALL